MLVRSNANGPRGPSAVRRPSGPAECSVLCARAADVRRSRPARPAMRCGKLCTGAVARAFLRAFELAIELQQEHQASPPLARLRERHRSGGPVTVCMSRTKEDSHVHRHEEDSQATLSSSALMLHSSPHRSRPRLLPRPLHSPPHAPPPVGAPETAPESSCAAPETAPESHAAASAP